MSARQIQIKTQAFLANLPMFSEMRAEELDRIAAATLPSRAEGRVDRPLRRYLHRVPRRRLRAGEAGFPFAPGRGESG
jgi:hypothetical protein